MSRLWLIRLITVMVVIIVVAFLYILLRGTVGFTTTANPESMEHQMFKDISLGETILRKEAGKLYWVSNFTDEQLTQLMAFSKKIVASQTGCSTDHQLCIVDAQTERAGVHLRYTESVPDQLAAEYPWVGGYVKSNNGAVYDLLGRAYQRDVVVERLQTRSFEVLTKPN